MGFAVFLVSFGWRVWVRVGAGFVVSRVLLFFSGWTSFRGLGNEPVGVRCMVFGDEQYLPNLEIGLVFGKFFMLSATIHL